MAASLDMDTVQDTALCTVYLCQVWSPKVNCDCISIWQTGSVLYTHHVLSSYSSLSRSHSQPSEGRLQATDSRSLRTGGMGGGGQQGSSSGSSRATSAGDCHVTVYDPDLLCFPCLLKD